MSVIVSKRGMSHYQITYQATPPSPDNTLLVECAEDCVAIDMRVAVRMLPAIRKRLENPNAHAAIQPATSSAPTNPTNSETPTERMQPPQLALIPNQHPQQKQQQPTGLDVFEPGKPPRLCFNHITARALNKVMEYCHVHNLPHPPADLRNWDEKFLRLEPNALCELASAAWHLEIKPLVDITCQAIAYLLKGKSPDEIRRTFNILYDFGPEDDAPPPTLRDRLRSKLCNPKRRDSKQQQVKATPSSGSTGPSSCPLLPTPSQNSSTAVEDTRSVEELLSFIDGGSSKAPSNGSKRKSQSKKEKKAKAKKVALRQSAPAALTSSATAVPAPINTSLSGSGNRGNRNALIASAPTCKTNGASENTKSSAKEFSSDEDSSGAGSNARIRATADTAPLSGALGAEDVDTLGEDTEYGDDEMDPELRAAQDKEVEEFRRRLEEISTVSIGPRRKIALPALTTMRVGAKH